MCMVVRCISPAGGLLLNLQQRAGGMQETHMAGRYIHYIAGVIRNLPLKSDALHIILGSNKNSPRLGVQRTRFYSNYKIL
jgi:hypothetical protein